MIPVNQRAKRERITKRYFVKKPNEDLGKNVEIMS